MTLAIRRQIEDELVAALGPLKKANGGYLRAVKEWNGEKAEDLARVLLGNRPAVAITTVHGAYTGVDTRKKRATEVIDIEMQLVSGTLRSREAQTKGGVVGDADPGIYKMIEDIRDILMGSESSIAGVGVYMPIDEKPLHYSPDLSVWLTRWRVIVDVKKLETPGAPMTDLYGRISLAEVVLASGAGDSFTYSGGFVTLTDSAGLFTAAQVGQIVVIRDATSPANNGSFAITSRLSATQIQYANTSGVTESYTGEWVIVPVPMLAIERGIGPVAPSLSGSGPGLGGVASLRIGPAAGTGATINAFWSRDGGGMILLTIGTDPGTDGPLFYIDLSQSLDEFSIKFTNSNDDAAAINLAEQILQVEQSGPLITVRFKQIGLALPPGAQPRLNWLVAF